MRTSVPTFIFAAAIAVASATPDDVAVACPDGLPYCCTRCALNLQDCFDACGQALSSCPCTDTKCTRTSQGSGGAFCCGTYTNDLDECFKECGVRCESSFPPIFDCPELGNAVSTSLHCFAPLVFHLPSNFLLAFPREKRKVVAKMESSLWLHLVPGGKPIAVRDVLLI